MNYRELRQHIEGLSDAELDSEVTIFDDINNRYHPVKSFHCADVDPNFPPLVYMEIYKDGMYIQQTVGIKVHDDNT